MPSSNTMVRPATTELNLSALQQTIPVTFQYQVHFTRGLFDPQNSLLANAIASPISSEPAKAIAIVDNGLLEHHPQLLEQLSAYAIHYSQQLSWIAPPVVVQGGEEVKNNPVWVEQLHQAIDKAGICRHSYVIAIGGGSVLDMAGYGAATAHRGIRLIRVPTTVLAQNDSGVGVKNGINAFGKKNFLGTFAPPHAVLNDFDFLTTLSDRDWRAGTAEAVKVALLKDAEFFDAIADDAEALANRSMAPMQTLIYRCAELHLNHIANYGDPFEKGSSRPLDFGHWSAHKLEQLSNYRLRHGEAVAIGIALDSLYSQLVGMLQPKACDRIIKTLKKLGFDLYVPELEANLSNPDHPSSLFRGMTEFREHLGGELTLMLLRGIGQGEEAHHFDLDFYRQAISLLKDWHTA